MVRILLLFLISIFAGPAAFALDVVPKVVCETFDPQVADSRSPGKVVRRNGESRLQQLTFKFEMAGYGSGGNACNVIDEVPVVAFPVESGWLLGSDHGEWGGMLVHKPENSEPYEVIRENIRDIYNYPFGYVVTTGLAHLGINEGSIYVVNEDLKGRFRAEKLHDLLGAPETSWLLKNGELLINMWGGASVILSKTGELRRVECINLKAD